MSTGPKRRTASGGGAQSKRLSWCADTARGAAVGQQRQQVVVLWWWWWWWRTRKKQQPTSNNKRQRGAYYSSSSSPSSSSSSSPLQSPPPCSKCSSTPLRALPSRPHRPSLGSCPIPASTNRPLRATASAFTKPRAWSAPNGSIEASPAGTRQSLTAPSPAPLAARTGRGQVGGAGARLSPRRAQEARRARWSEIGAREDGRDARLRGHSRGTLRAPTPTTRTRQSPPARPPPARRGRRLPRGPSRGPSSPSSPPPPPAGTGARHLRMWGGEETTVEAHHVPTDRASPADPAREKAPLVLRA